MVVKCSENRQAEPKKNKRIQDEIGRLSLRDHATSRLVSTSLNPLQTNLSANPNKPCYMVHVRGLNLLLDCGLDLSSTLSFLPLPLVPSAKLSSLAAFNFKDENNDNVEWVSPINFEVEFLLLKYICSFYTRRPFCQCVMTTSLQHKKFRT